MTGPMYDNERMQELAEDNGYLKSKLRAAEIANAEWAVKMEWSPAKWDQEFKHAENEHMKEFHKRCELERELEKTKAALEDALHDAKRWRAIAGAEPSEKGKAANLPDGRDVTEKMARVLTVPGWPMLTYIGRNDRSIYITFEGPAYGYVHESSLQWILDESMRQRELREAVLAK